ncbi:amidophosphoribosyltransferase [Hathewaya proteolytica DSM 3090]|uniref:Amidophosphoribosyltransferase n=1 Tax=Hathewaya proteolytica DSM 3090 TaxID=1121331 RepID=A0A1M6P6B8_9CLOT|nr:amidophosphoribosyltransferase [Hathewaya proteolytica]SHK03448.1 amidophosphoribosyltransferase [Hathewaya proteolytica DSM 3090]
MENRNDDKLHEACGVYGIYCSDTEAKVGTLTYYGLYALQHRGQESCGIVTTDGEKMNSHKGMGIASEVFNEHILSGMNGKSAIGHVRYATAGESSIKNAQPVVGACKLGELAIAHNGTLINTSVIRELLEDCGSIFQTSVDSEVVLNLISRSAKKGMESAVIDAMQAIKGSYALVILTNNELIGVRDPNGIRPLCLGKLENGYVLASESCALDCTGATYVRDIEPGEIVIINDEGIKSINFVEKSKKAVCAFEYVYFARPDSVMDGISVNNARYLSGRKLYEESPVEADIVIGVPDSGIPAAIGYSRASGIPFEMGLIKNRYVGRTFIAPTQELREKAVAVKLNALKEVVNGKSVVLIDDSIVRGTTSKRLIDTLRKAGAKEVHLRIASPIVQYPCYFGIDTPNRKELIGANMEVDKIAETIGADSLAYISCEGLVECIKKDGGFCLGCFNGVYPMSAPKNE